MGHELRRKIIEGSLWRCIELSDHLPSRLPKERQVLLGVLAPNVVYEHMDTFVIIVSTDLFELG